MPLSKSMRCPVPIPLNLRQPTPPGLRGGGELVTVSRMLRPVFGAHGPAGRKSIQGTTPPPPKKHQRFECGSRICTLFGPRDLRKGNDWSEGLARSLPPCTPFTQECIRVHPLLLECVCFNVHKNTHALFAKKKTPDFGGLDPPFR